MSDVREQLINAKRQLVQVLGENEKSYWANMKAWFKYRISKEEFDTEARRLLPKNESHLHNQFLLAVLTKCHVSGSSSGSKDLMTSQTSNKLKKNKRLQAIKRKFDHRFTVNQSTPTIPPALNTHHNRSQKNVPPQQPIKMCSKTLQVPTVEELTNFVSVISWEMGLDDATDGVMTLATEAVHVFLKNLLSAIFSRRSAYKSYNKTFKYAMGCEPENPYLLSKKMAMPLSSRASYDAKEQERIESLGKEIQDASSEKRPVNMYDLLHTLQVFRSSVIPSHTVYTLATERVIAGLWHPDKDELKQDKLIAELMN